MKHILILTLLVLSTTTARAQLGTTTSLNAEPVRAACAETDSEVGYGACIVDLLERQEEVMNAELEAVKQQVVVYLEDLTLSQDDAEAGARHMWERLDQSQQAWLAWRDAECEMELLDYWGGSAASKAVHICQLNLSKERTRVLREEQHELELD